MPTFCWLMETHLKKFPSLAVTKSGLRQNHATGLIPWRHHEIWGNLQKHSVSSLFRLQLKPFNFRQMPSEGIGQNGLSGSPQAGTNNVIRTEFRFTYLHFIRPIARAKDDAGSFVVKAKYDSRYRSLRVPLILSLVYGTAPLIACSSANKSKFVFGDANTVSLVSGPFAPEALANWHCENHGKRAIHVSSSETGPYSNRWIHYFNCDDPIRE